MTRKEVIEMVSANTGVPKYILEKKDNRIFNPQEFLEKNCKKELEDGLRIGNEIYCKVHRAGYHMGWVDGTEHGVNKVKAVMDWFKATYNTEYVLYDSDSITHLLDMYQDSREAMYEEE